MYTFIPLFTIEDFPEISNKYNNNIPFDIALRQAQEIKLRYILGDELYYQLVVNYQDNNIYQILWEGESYLNNDNKMLYYFGIKEYLKQMTLLFYYKNSALIDTGSGVEFPENENSQKNPVNLKEIIAEKRFNSNRYKANIVVYLDYKNDVYELWNGDFKREWAGGIF